MKKKLLNLKNLKLLFHKIKKFKSVSIENIKFQLKIIFLANNNSYNRNSTNNSRNQTNNLNTTNSLSSYSRSQQPYFRTTYI
jgi:hypothetical protein